MEVKVKVKELVASIRKCLLFSFKYTYRFACEHPFVASFSLFLFLLYNWFPSIFAFLVSSSPVISCTAVLLGILLSYGEPNIPEIEEEDMINWEVSSLKKENPADDLFHKKIESYTLEDLVNNRVRTEEWTSRDLAPSPDGVKEKESDFLAISSLVEEQNKIGKEHNLECGFVENLEVLMKENSESHVRTCEVTDGASEGIEGLMVKINNPGLDEWLDSSLGSPWQPINIHDATSGSESDRAESSSPDASLTDIFPMLDELNPLLNSEAHNHAQKSADYSDLELSQHHESDEDSVVHDDEHKIEENDESNRAVTWTADDQKNVMDLGSSDLERNRRLENLIARRRARKNQIIIFEKDLIDLHSNATTMDELLHFSPQMHTISAPRSNPFDLLQDLDESKGFPPIPGSAPSVLLYRQNPFDFPCDSEDGNKGPAGENLSQLEFGLPSQSDYLYRRHEGFASHSLFPSNFLHEKHGCSRLNPYFVAARMDSEGNDYIDFHRQLTGKSDTESSSVPALDTMSSVIDPEGQKVLTEQEMQEHISLSAPDHDARPSERYGQSYKDDLADFHPELGEDGLSVDPNTSAVTKETYQGIDSSSIAKKAVEEIEFGSSMLDGQKHEMVEEKNDDLTLFFSSAKIEKTLDISLPEVLEAQEQIISVSKGSSESRQSSEIEGVDNDEAAIPIYDSSPFGSGNFLSEISVPNDNLLSSGRGDLYSASSMESHVKEDALEVVSQPREFEVIHGSKLQGSTSCRGEPLIFSTYMNLLDENILASKEVSKTGEQDFDENRSAAGINENEGYLASSLKIDHSSSLSATEGDNKPIFEISAALLPSEAEGKHQSMEKLEMQKYIGTYLEEFHISNLDLGPIPEESSEYFKVKEENMNLVQATTAFSSTALHGVEEPNVGYEGNEEGLAFLTEKAKHSNASNLVLSNDDVCAGLVIGELMDSMESKLNSELEFTSNYDRRDSQDNIIYEFQFNQDVILRNLNDFHSEPGDVDVEVREIQVIDEHLLSELDAVCDFHVEDLKSPQFFYMESQSASQFDCSVAEKSPNKSISANLNTIDDMDLVLDQEESTDSAYWPLEMTPFDELEMTVYNPKLNVLQACSLEEFAEPPLCETIPDKLVAEKPVVNDDSKPIIIEEKYVKHIDSTLEEVTAEGLSVGTTAVEARQRQQDDEVEYVEETIVTCDKAVTGENMPFRKIKKKKSEKV